MMEIALYSALAIFMVVLVVWLARQGDRRDGIETDLINDHALRPFDRFSLSLAEQVFDPTDYIWLRDKVCFPHLAQALRRSRKRAALRWLNGLRMSFDDLVRTPETAPAKNPTGDAAHSWQLLWAFLYFHCLVWYATLVVWILGPYHRLIPSLDWLQPFRAPATEGLSTKHLT